MSGTFFLFLGGLVALAFLVLIWRRRKMPMLLRAILIIAAAAIVIFVGWTLFAVASGPALPK
ncbi:MAG: hypothetical protein ABJB69_02235 [Spartobacteria bacterium]